MLLCLVIGLVVTSKDYGTIIEELKLGRAVLFIDEVLCRDTDSCLPINSLGDFSGIPTKIVLPSRFMDIYTLFSIDLPILKVKTQGCVFSNGSWHVTQVETLCDELIKHFCDLLFMQHCSSGSCGYRLCASC